MRCCPKCGVSVSDGARFCKNCGSELPASKGTAGTMNMGTKAIVVICTLTAIVAVIVVVVAMGKPQTNAPAISTNAESVQTNKASSTSASTEKNTEEDATKNKAAAENDEAAALEKQQAGLREEAEAAGETVLVGTLNIYDGPGLAELLGTTDELYANGDKATQAEQNSEYAILSLDEPQSLYVTQDPTNPHTMDASHVCLGSRRFNAYNGSYGEDGVEPWREYEGQRICVAGTDFYASDGVSVNTAPTTKTGRFLYSTDEDGSTTPETAPAKESEPAQQQDYDPTWSTSTDTTFEAADFIVTVPEEWAGQWSCSTTTEVGDGAYAWIFEYTGPTNDGPPGMWKGGGLVVAPTDDEPSISSYAIWKRAVDGKSSNGNSLWFVSGDPQGFFAMDGEPGATITLK